MKRFIRKNVSCRKSFCVLKSAFLCLTVIILMVSAAAADQGNKKITVMSRNLYVGADILKVFEVAANPNAGPLDIPKAVAEIFETIQYTDFQERAQAIADEIERWQPDLIGLQEVSEILEQVPGDYLSGNQKPAEEVVYDYLSILMEALEERGLCYEVAGEVTGADVELPMLAGYTGGYPILKDVRLIDHDVILARKGVEVKTVVAGNFSTNISMPIGGTGINFKRGYIIAEVKVDQRKLRFVNTHLEIGGGPGDVLSAVQAAQMHELLTILAGEDKPAVLLGDLNSTPEETPIESLSYGLIVPPYMQAVNSGYIDIFSVPKKLPEPTCCFNETVDDPDASLDTRIDHIFVSDSLDIKKPKPRTIGDKESDMNPTGLWPSDHAGVIGTIKF